MKTWDFLPEFIEALKEQLKSDQERWGDTWLHRTRNGQEERTMETIIKKFDQYKESGKGINWLQIAGSALICWIRENHPEIWPE